MRALESLSPERLDGVTCIVTGGGNGIGFATALCLARAGAHVGIVDRVQMAAEKAARAIASASPSIKTSAAAADVTDQDQVAQAFAALSLQLGTAAVLVNCAGIMTPNMVPVAEMSENDFVEMLNVHVVGTFLCSKAVLAGMQSQGFGRIINISSVLGLLGLPNRIGYATAKTGIIGFTRALAMETARSGITVNAVAPGYILTETLQQRVDAGMIDYARLAERAPVGRWGIPEEIARVVAFLALPGSGFITGTTIPVDGGYSVRGDPNEELGCAEVSINDIRTLFSKGS